MDGFLWPRTLENSMADVPCSSAGSLFRGETRALRPCLNSGNWGAPDLTTCTLRQDAVPFLLIWFILEINIDDGRDMSPDGILSDSRLESEV